MIIDVKGTKGGGQPSEAESRQRYELKAAKASKMPLAFGALILGLAAYLKSAMPTWGRLPDEGEAPLRPEDSGKPHLKLVDAGMLSVPLELLEQGDAQPEEQPQRIRSSSLHDWRLPSAEFMMVDSPPLLFTVPSLQRSDVSRHARFEGAIFASNDNLAPVTGSRPGGGMGGFSKPRGAAAADNPRGDDRDDKGEDDKPRHSDPIPKPVEDEDDPRPAANRAPRVNGPVYLRDVAGCATVLISLSDLLAHASDEDGDMLSIRNAKVSSGTISWTANGWLYDPNGLGPVTVTYEITDGKATIIQHAYFSVVRNSIVGTDGDDMLLGSACADEIMGKGGNDIIDGRAGDDLIDGGAGDDHIMGGAGNDILRGGDGNDIIFGGAGNDQISGGAGDDRLFGDDGDDTVFGDGGDDQINGGNGNDILFGGNGNDLVNGDAGDDRIEGNAGHDVLDGGDGNDVVSGGDGNDEIEGGKGADLLLDGAGRDTVSGGEGDDHVLVALDGDHDIYDGAAGIDTLDLTGTERGVEVDLAEGTAEGCEIGDNGVSGFEIVRGGSGADSIFGSAGDETLSGGAGDDRIDGRGGNDVVDGGAGNDTLHDGCGQDTVLGGEGNDRIVVASDGDSDRYDGGTGTDTLDLSQTGGGVSVDLSQGTANGSEIGNNVVADFEVVSGGSGNDTIAGSGGNETLSGGAGDDRIDGRAGDDFLESEAGNDIITDGAGRDTASGGAGNDLIRAEADGDDDVYDGGEDCDTLDYSSSEEGITVDFTNGTASGCDIGNDTISGFETVVGGSGDDHFIVGRQPVVLKGGDGDDLFEFTPPPPASAPAPVLHEIVDFKAGDRIKMSKYDIFEKVFDKLEDQFESIYGDKVDDDDARIRFRHERSESIDRTVIEADLDCDDIYETTIHLDGNRAIVIVEHA
ncbi:calcium-binding protein [Microvirga calopogonii]|uniref:calcium-binding protein n=1 Tax=Microvirga calopogonii TaxID=2078013 RepID=UPI000E0D90C0|nr:cadherin-like domain-containing protein [Microvirga calopogonii]